MTFTIMEFIKYSEYKIKIERSDIFILINSSINI